MKKILLINAHPRKDSFIHALTDAYEAGAKAAGHEIRRINLSDLTFDPIFRTRYRDNVLEPDLLKQQELIQWCTHLVITTPVWWMSTPALLKGYFDRVLTPGFGYKYREKSLIPFPKRLLKGRSARVIYTQGGPTYLTNILGFDAFWKALKYGVLLFCGFGPVRRTVCASISTSTEEKRKLWLQEAERLGRTGK